MRTRRLITAAAATAATLMLLAASPTPTNANTLAQDTNTNPGITTINDVKIAAVQSRADQHPTNTEGNAIELRNTGTTLVDLEDASVQVFNSSSTLVASITFLAGDEIPAGGSFLIRDADFWPTPRVIPTAQIVSFSVTGGDDIPDSFGVTLVDTNGIDQIDSLATVSGISVVALNPDKVGEGTEALALDGNTDPFNAAIRRDVLYTDSGNNEDDFQRRPAMWGVPL